MVAQNLVVPGNTNVSQLSTIFYLSANDYDYRGQTPVALPGQTNCYLPIEVDTEFTHAKTTLIPPFPKRHSPTITVQCRAVALPQGQIFTHLDCAAYARHPLVTDGFAIVTYLKSLGYDASIHRCTVPNDELPWMQIDLYAFFAVAELMRLGLDKYRDDLIEKCLDTERKGHGIQQGRRLRTYTRCQGQYLPWVAMPWVLTVNGISYAVRLCWYDTSAVHGATGYAGFCHNTGTPIPYKDNFTSAEKADMLRMYIERPEDFDNYALGDLYNHTALMNNTKLFENAYRVLGISEHFKNPRLTTGATVRDILESCVVKGLLKVHPEHTPRQIVNAYCMEGTAAKVKTRTATTAAYNAKVDGGRCRNNRPTDTAIKGAVCDLDISGCYGEGLRSQLYPLGNPVIIDYPLDSPRNEYMTLRKFLSTYGKNLVPGLWQARVSTLEGVSLKYAQDYLMSWFPPKNIGLMPTDSDLNETDEWWSVDNVGTLKTLTHQVNLAVITHDFVQWLENVASPRQRKEMLDHLYVHTAMYYPASERVHSVEELRHRHDTHTGKNTCTIKQVKGRTTKISVHQECHAWYGQSLGDLLITVLLLERKSHTKGTPLNDLYKLIVNTTFGDMVSPYFTVGNVVVGNNITARARALAWFMEKGLHGWQTITDGCAFDLNRVLHNGDTRVTGENAVGLYHADSRDLNVEFKPLGGQGRIDLHIADDGSFGLNLSGQVLDAKSSLEWVNRVAMEHLQGLFPNVDVLRADTTDVNGVPRKGQFGFEAKGLYDAACFHGTANYMFQREGEVVVVKMRSYSARARESLRPDGLTVESEDFYPAKQFLTAIMHYVDRVERQSVYLKASILKVGDFSRHYAHKYEGSSAFPGMTVKQASLLREFSLSQFTYRNIEQYRAWEKESDSLRKRYGQSYEQYFLNADGTLNYQAMLNTIGRKISEGRKGFWDGENKRSKHGYRQQVEHPANNALAVSRDALAHCYGFKSVVSEEDHGDV